MNTGNLNTELAPVSRLRKRDVAKVELNIEIRVGNPIGVIQPHGHFDHAITQGRNFMEAAFKELNNFLKTQYSTIHRRLVVNTQ